MNFSKVVIETNYYGNGNIMSKTNWYYPTEKQLQFSINPANVIHDLKTDREKIRIGECFVYHKNGGIKHIMNYNDNGKLIASKSFRQDGSLVTY